MTSKLALYILAFFTLTLNAEVKPPNYDFSLDNLAPFLPGKNSNEALKGKKRTLMEGSGPLKIERFYVAQIRYKFPVFLQTYEGENLDFIARLPTYFLHDIFFQSLINRYGKQNTYTHKGRSALYTWDLKEKDLIINYRATCTITCFPEYLYIRKKSPPKGLVDYPTLISKFQTSY